MHKLGFVMQKPSFIMQKLGSSGQEPCFTRFQPRQWFIDPLVVIHPYLSSKTSLFSNAFCANCAGPEQCFTMFRPRQWFIDPLVVIHPYLSRNTLLVFNAFCATFAGPHTVGCYACLFVSIASLMSSI